MENLTIIKDIDGVEIVIITKENGSIISMLKSTYDEQQAALNEGLVK
jgi:hypothetical protein